MENPARCGVCHMMLDVSARPPRLDEYGAPMCPHCETTWVKVRALLRRDS